MDEKFLNGTSLSEAIKMGFVRGKDLNSWKISKNKIKKIFKFRDFKENMVFVNKIAEIAEQKNHHPNICIDYNKTEITLWTHSENKATEKDFNLSKEIDKINESNSGN